MPSVHLLRPMRLNISKTLSHYTFILSFVAPGLTWRTIRVFCETAEPESLNFTRI